MKIGLSYSSIIALIPIFVYYFQSILENYSVFSLGKLARNMAVDTRENVRIVGDDTETFFAVAEYFRFEREVQSIFQKLVASAIATYVAEIELSGSFLPMHYTHFFMIVLIPILIVWFLLELVDDRFNPAISNSPKAWKWTANTIAWLIAILGVFQKNYAVI